MKRLLLFCAAAGLLLSSATPPSPARKLAVDPAVFRDESLAVPAMPAATPAPAPPEPVEAAAPPPAAPPADEGAGSEAAEAGEPERQLAPAKGRDGLRILVSIPQQKAYVFEDGELLATSPVSTGKRGHETPAGTFRILEKKVHHRSSKYDNAPMPYMQRLTWYGIALHAGHVPGYPASHGCIRLPRAFAKKLYGLTDRGTSVTITRRRPASNREAARLA